jgi:hypothetical protein
MSNLIKHNKEIDYIALNTLNEITNLNSKIIQLNGNYNYICFLINDYFDEMPDEMPDKKPDEKPKSCPKLYPSEKSFFICDLDIITEFLENVKKFFNKNTNQNINTKGYKNQYLKDLISHLFKIRIQLNTLIDYAIKNKPNFNSKCDEIPIDKLNNSLSELDGLISMVNKL